VKKKMKKVRTRSTTVRKAKRKERSKNRRRLFKNSRRQMDSLEEAIRPCESIVNEFII